MRCKINNSINNILYRITIIAVCVSVLSQFPTASSNIDILNFTVWGFVGLCFLLVPRSFCVSRFLLILVFTALWFSLFQGIGYITGNIKSISSLIRTLCIPILLYYVSYYLSKNANFIKLFEIFLFSIIALSLFVIVTQIFGNFNNWLTSSVYLLQGNTHKNTMGQLVGSAIIILLLLGGKFDVFKFKIIQLMALLVLMLTLFFVQSRSSLLLICLFLFFYLIKKIKWKAIFILPFFSIFFFNINILNILLHAFQIKKYTIDGSLDLDAFSSGRISLYIEAIKVFLSAPLVGVGRYYVDNMVLNSLCNGGLIGGGVLIATIFIRIYKNIKYSINRLENHYYIFSITMFYLGISFFEALPPYGPGVASMMFWFSAGYVDAKSHLTLKL